MDKRSIIYSTLVLAIMVIIGAGMIYFFGRSNVNVPPEQPDTHKEEIIKTPLDAPLKSSESIGTSVEGRDIEVYRFGTGKTQLLFVGGIHGGYEWNSVLLAYAFIDYFTEHPENIPQNVTVHIIPSANPDGVFAVMGKEGRFRTEDAELTSSQASGRFNAHAVDLNRNFDCKWKPKSMWQGKEVSAGTEAFSEPEARTIREYVLAQRPDAVVFWHSQSNAVYASECTEGILPATRTLMQTYATASGYKPVDTFDAYPITGDAEGWLASIGIPAITVELATHKSIEFEKNRAGLEAVFAYYTETLNR